MTTEMYRGRAAGEPVDFDNHEWLEGWFVPVTEPLLSRVEWEATINYEAMLDRFITKAVSLDSEGWSRDFAMTQLREIVGVDVAVGEETP